VEKILLLGDVHGRVGSMNRVMWLKHNVGFDAAVFLGDTLFAQEKSFMEALGSLDVPTYVLGGNHEDYDLIRAQGLAVYGTEPANAAVWSETAGRNMDHMFWLPRGSHFTLGSTSFCAVGGAVSIDQASRTHGIDWWPEETIEYRKLEGNLQQSDVALFHDAPSYPDIDIFLSDARPFGTESRGHEMMKAARDHRGILDWVVEQVQPSKVFHGHYHDDFHSVVGNVSYWGLCNIDAGILEMDKYVKINGDLVSEPPSGSWFVLEV